MIISNVRKVLERVAAFRNIFLSPREQKYDVNVLGDSTARFNHCGSERSDEKTRNVSTQSRDRPISAI